MKVKLTYYRRINGVVKEDIEIKDFNNFNEAIIYSDEMTKNIPEALYVDAEVIPRSKL